MKFSSFFHPGAWFLIVLGVILFSLRIPVAETYFVNFPVAVSTLQIIGLMFTLFGVQMIVSMFLWPNLKVVDLIREVYEENNTGAGLVLAGLLVFNGLSLLAFAIWTSGAAGSVGIGGR